MGKKKPIPPIHPCQLRRGYSTNKLHENCNPSMCMLEGLTCINMLKLKANIRYDRASFLKKKLINILED